MEDIKVKENVDSFLNRRGANQNHRLIFASVTGSKAYNLSRKESDYDYVGFFSAPPGTIFLPQKCFIWLFKNLFGVFTFHQKRWLQNQKIKEKETYPFTNSKSFVICSSEVMIYITIQYRFWFNRKHFSC